MLHLTHRYIDYDKITESQHVNQSKCLNDKGTEKHIRSQNDITDYRAYDFKFQIVSFNALSRQPPLNLSNLSEGVTQGKGTNWLLKKTGDHLLQVHLHCIWVQGAQKMRLLMTGDP